jgi:hypothetical protein
MTRHILTTITLAVVLLGALVSPAATAARQATPAASPIPERTAPLGLGTIALPEDGPAIVALFKIVMREGNETRFAGMTTEKDRITLSIGNPADQLGPSRMLQAVNLPAGDFFPADFTAANYVALAARAKDTGTVAYGQDGVIVWIQAETTAGMAGDDPATPETTRPLYTLAWGNADSPWLFTASANSEAGLTALVTAFVTAAGSTAATPEAVATPTQ